ncbi:MAG: triose-phosphate isomerase [Deltaproteobacteria bacterium]|jgi:triosephosphate isomerase|nr:triose-phosphate isomerase [Deltaproteobacteria bacterium]
MKKMIAANWKMYKTRREAVQTTAGIITNILGKRLEDREFVIFAPFTALQSCADVLNAEASGSRLFLGAQDVYPAGEGAFTGEISPVMLLDCSCAWVLAGHSERRHLLGESDEFIGKKTAFALESGLNVVLCIGETLVERESGQLERVLSGQMSAGLAAVPKDIKPSRLVFAYEPVWAIGTGKVAGSEEIMEAHALVRRLIKNFFPLQYAHMRILYGGSVKPDNAGQLIKLDNVDGLLVGGASMEAESFSRIALA